jgi:membrane-associated phospholipid phosphatase
MITRRHVIAGFGAAFANMGMAQAGLVRKSPEDVLQQWFGLILDLVRHTATYSPPVASRSFAYLGIVAFETVASGSGALQSLAGQLPGLSKLPARQAGTPYDEATVLHGALARAVSDLFANTGPTGQRAISAALRLIDKELQVGIPAKRFQKSKMFGESIADHVLQWSMVDGGAHVDLMGFASTYKPDARPGHWTPTSAISLQQKPLLPAWGSNRTFTVDAAQACSLPPPPAYSEDKSSEFYKQALEVYTTVKNITPEQRLIARFWSDDPMLSPTPPGHWLFITLDLFAQRNTKIEDCVDVLARLGMAVSDAFVVCWKSKFDYDLLRPITYIKKHIDKTWEPILITPPFPEYPSGHSTQSGAAVGVLAHYFGDHFAFEDRTHVREKLPVRSFASFADAAQEAGISRLYGGIHFRAAIERGLDQGRCVADAVNALKTRRTA